MSTPISIVRACDELQIDKTSKCTNIAKLKNDPKFCISGIAAAARLPIINIGDVLMAMLIPSYVWKLECIDKVGSVKCL